MPITSTGPRTHRFVPVDVLTASYRVVGKMMVSNTGVIGLLSNPNTDFIEIHDARLARIHMPTKLADHFKVVRMSKQHLFIVSLNRREDIGPKALARAGYSTVRQHKVLITSQSYEAEGALEWQGRLDFRVLMTEGTRDFVPLYNANLRGVLIPALKIQSAVMLFNRKLVDIFGILGQRQEDEK